jgi:hypothetical protein
MAARRAAKLERIQPASPAGDSVRIPLFHCAAAPESLTGLVDFADSAAFS